MPAVNKRSDEFLPSADVVQLFRHSHPDKLGSAAVPVSGGNEFQSGIEPTAMTGPTREELDAKLAASEARADARMTGLFHQFEGRLFQHIDAKLGSLDGKFAAVDAKFAGMESRFGNMDAKLSGMQTDVAVLNTRMSNIEGNVSGLKGTVITTGIAVVALTVAVLAYGGQWFGMGMDASAIAEQAAERALEKRVSEKQVLNQPEKPKASEPAASSK